MTIAKKVAPVKKIFKKGLTNVLKAINMLLRARRHSRIATLGAASCTMKP